MTTDIVITLIASAISGVAGLYIQRYLSRAKPTLNVTSLTFEGDVVEVSDEIQRLTRRCDWSPNIDRYISYEGLKDFEVHIAQASAALQQEKENVDEWLENFNSDGLAINFSIGQMMRSPALADLKVFGGYFRGSLRRREMPELPTSLADLKQQNELFSVEINQSKFSVHCGHFEMSFKKEEYSEDIYPQIEQLIYSVSRGNGANMLKLHETFSSYAGSQVYDYQKLLVEVRKHLIDNSKLSLSVSISNTGQTPVILKPYFAVKLEFGEKTKSIVLENTKKQISKKEVPFVDLVRSEQYQKSATSTNYVNVSPGTTVQVTLISSDGLRGDSHAIAEFYELGGLKGQVYANTESGAVVKSNLSTFSKAISEADRKSLIKIAS